MTIGAFAGSFDPITKGHLALIKKATRVVDQLWIVIASNSDKKSYFPDEKKIGLIKSALMFDLTPEELAKCGVIVAPAGLTVDFCDELRATIMFRGLRNTTDYEYEANLEQYNTDLAPHITTVYLRTPPTVTHISSSGVKSLVGQHNWPARIEKYIHPATLSAFMAVQRKKEQCFTEVVR